MKRYMPEMTNLQVHEYLEGGGRTVLVPVGSTETTATMGRSGRTSTSRSRCASGPPRTRRARRAAGPVRASAGSPRCRGIIYVRLETFVGVLRDICVSLTEAGFERIALVNGHY